MPKTSPTMLSGMAKCILIAV